jgi:hypothetical protein
MIARQLGAWLIAGTIALSLLGALAIGLRGQGEPDRGSARRIVQLPPAMAARPAAQPAPSREGSDQPDVEPLPDPRIASTLADPGATFRSVQAADEANKVVCGEVRRSGQPYYQRFVWIAEAQLLATDDGGPQFASVARLCDGLASLGPA